jgi:hypothetical protein
MEHPTAKGVLSSFQVKIKSRLDARRRNVHKQGPNPFVRRVKGASSQKLS